MRETYTANDGTTFDTKEDCLAYEMTTETLRAFYNEQDGAAERLGFQPMFVHFLKQGFYSVEELVSHRKEIKRSSDLLNPVPGSTDPSGLAGSGAPGGRR